MSPDDLAQRNNITIIGEGDRTLLLAHGFGCDQNMWRFITPALARDYRVVLFDYVGSGNSDLSAFNRRRYGELEGYAQDILEIGWANYMAPLLLGADSGAQLVSELSGRFCSTDPLVAKTFAQATFFSDYRHLLAQAKHPSLLLQSQTDALAAVAVGEYMHARMPGSTLKVIPAQGHCLHMTHPDAVIEEIRRYLATGKSS